MQYCKNCGGQNPDGARFCERCGQTLPAPQPYQQPQYQQPPQYPQYQQPPQYPQPQYPYPPPPGPAPPGMYQQQYQMQQQQEAEKLAKNALIVGVIGLVIFGWILGFIAIYWGSKARKLDPSKGMGGIVLGIIDVIGAFLILPIICLL